MLAHNTPVIVRFNCFLAASTDLGVVETFARSLRHQIMDLLNEMNGKRWYWTELQRCVTVNVVSHDLAIYRIDNDASN